MDGDKVPLSARWYQLWLATEQKVCFYEHVKITLKLPIFSILGRREMPSSSWRWSGTSPSRWTDLCARGATSWPLSNLIHTGRRRSMNTGWASVVFKVPLSPATCYLFYWLHSYNLSVLEKDTREVASARNKCKTKNFQLFPIAGSTRIISKLNWKKK